MKNHENRTTERSIVGCGSCLFFYIFVDTILECILWLIWLIQGKPDNWYGKMFNFSLKITIWICIIIAVIVLVWVIIHAIKRLLKKGEK